VNVLAGNGPLAAVYARRGPFVTIYLDLTPHPVSGSDVIDERWSGVRESLEQNGATEDDLDALEEAIVADPGGAGAHGLVAVATGGEVCLAERMPTPPSANEGVVAPLPRLLPYLVKRLPTVPNVVAVAGPWQPYVARATGGGLETTKRFTAGTGLDRVAEEVALQVSRERAELLLVAGPRRIREQMVVELGGRVDPSVDMRLIDGAETGPEAVEQAVCRLLIERTETERASAVATLRGGRRARAVAGVDAVASALRMAQVDTVVVAEDKALSSPCWVGARPTEFGLHEADAPALGILTRDHDRIDSAIVRAAYATRARLVVARTGEVRLTQGIGALLRAD
jgi:hypothetical protein